MQFSMPISSRITHILEPCQTKLLMKLFITRNQILVDTYELGRDVYVKIQQGNKPSAWAKIAKWIGHSSQSDGHCIYWPDSHKVTVERNIYFNTAKEPSSAPILPNDNLEDSIKMSTKRPITLQPKLAQEQQWEQIHESHEDDVPISVPVFVIQSSCQHVMERDAGEDETPCVCDVCVCLFLGAS